MIFVRYFLNLLSIVVISDQAIFLLSTTITTTTHDTTISDSSNDNSNNNNNNNNNNNINKRTTSTYLSSFSQSSNSFYSSTISANVELLSSVIDSRKSVECIDIVENVSLCNGIGYTKMRLPNLLDHDTVYEVMQQSASWVPLLNIKCHRDTKRFLCSLFCPVCLEQKIYPCRSLCRKVQNGCETRMKMYGFPWPDMFDCRRFPIDNDMCITSEMVSNSSEIDNQCKICEQTGTIENILDSYCQSTIAMRAKLKKISWNYFTFKKMKTFKGANLILNDMFAIESPEKCCESVLNMDQSMYFVIGNFQENRIFKPTLIVPWSSKQSKSFKRTIKMLRTLNCSNPDNVRHTIISHSPMMMLAYPRLAASTISVSLFLSDRDRERRSFVNRSGADKRTSSTNDGKKRKRKHVKQTDDNKSPTENYGKNKFDKYIHVITDSSE